MVFFGIASRISLHCVEESPFGSVQEVFCFNYFCFFNGKQGFIKSRKENSTRSKINKEAAPSDHKTKDTSAFLLNK